MGEAIGGMLISAVGIAISPLPLIAVILMLATPHGRTSGVAFTVGWAAGLATVVAVIVAATPVRSKSLGEGTHQGSGGATVHRAPSTPRTGYGRDETRDEAADRPYEGPVPARHVLHGEADAHRPEPPGRTGCPARCAGGGGSSPRGASGGFTGAVDGAAADVLEEDGFVPQAAGGRDAEPAWGDVDGGGEDVPGVDGRVGGEHDLRPVGGRFAEGPAQQWAAVGRGGAGLGVEAVGVGSWRVGKARKAAGRTTSGALCVRGSGEHLYREAGLGQGRLRPATCREGESLAVGGGPEGRFPRASAHLRLDRAGSRRARRDPGSAARALLADDHPRLLCSLRAGIRQHGAGDHRRSARGAGRPARRRRLPGFSPTPLTGDSCLHPRRSPPWLVRLMRWVAWKSVERGRSDPLCHAPA
ncbi:GAP family protein [Streptomyces sp. NPDC018007]|uniref:GAP family protein n=1 Tax=Streptomyces sp. NPDC018007 TaxID=3365029 RepID=UPI0037ACF6B9